MQFAYQDANDGDLVTFLYNVNVSPFHDFEEYVYTVPDCGALFSISVNLAGVQVAAFLDSGSGVSILSDEFFYSMPLESQPSLQPHYGYALRSATGHLFQILGKCTLPLHINGYTSYLTFTVVDNFPHAVLFGNDTFLKLRCQFDFNSLILQSPYGFAYRMFETQKTSHSTARLCHTITIPPGSALHTSAVCDEALTSKYLVVEPNACTALHIQRTVALNRPDRIVHIVILNVSTQPLKVQKGQAVAVAVQVASNVNAIDVPPDYSSQTNTDILRELEKFDLTTDSALDNASHIVMREFLKKNSLVFAPNPSNPGPANVEPHYIVTDPEARPVHCRPARASEYARKAIDKQIDMGLKAGQMEPATGPWASRVVIVRKHDGTPRFCIDYRDLNKVTVKDVYPLPRIDDTLDRLQGSCYFSSLDLASGYWQVPVFPKHRYKTAFITHRGLHQFKVMPFGLCNAPATFQRMIDLLLAGFSWEFVMAYIDDIIIFSVTFVLHLKHLQLVFDKLIKVRLHLKLIKCQFCRFQFLYLGHLVSRFGVATDPSKIIAIKSAPAPTNLTELRSWISIMGYYRRFVRDFSRIAAPLRKLLKKDQEFKWCDAQQNAFVKLRNALISAPILIFPDFTKQFRLDTDGSKFGLGIVLSQQSSTSKLYHVVAYGSRATNSNEANYSAPKLELLAVLYGCEHFRPYLLGRRFLLVTDHRALLWLVSTPKPPATLARWILRLSEFDFAIKHRAGTKHTNADALSRPPFATHAAKSYVNFLEHVELEGFTNQQLRKLQRDDSALRPFFAYLENKELPSELPKRSYVLLLKELLFIDNGLLWHRYPGPITPVPTDVIHQIVIPRSLRTSILKACHDENFSGHLGFNKTYDKIKRRFWWPNLYTEVRQYVLGCVPCQKRKHLRINMDGPLQPQLISRPWERMSMDLLGPLPITRSGNKYLLVCNDHFTRWVEAFALADITMPSIANVIITRIICRFGCPEQILTDRGSNFLSKVGQLLYKALRVKKINTSSYHPQTNALTERFNLTFCEMCSQYVNLHQTDWDEHIPYLLFAYNTSTHPTTKCTPFYLTYLRDPILPIDITFRTPSQLPRFNVNTYTRLLSSRLVEAANVVKHSVMKQHAASKKRWDAHVRPRQFNIGDRVWIFMPKLLGLPRKPKGTQKSTVAVKRTKKFGLRWRGRYRVTKRVGQSLYALVGPNNKPKDHLTNIRFMKPCHDWVDPNRDITDDIPTLIEQWHQQNTAADAVRATVLPAVRAKVLE